MVCEADTDGGAANKRSFIAALISICLFARGVLGVLLPALALRRRDALIAIIELRLCYTLLHLDERVVFSED